jgi:hypothetical protein
MMVSGITSAWLIGATTPVRQMPTYVDNTTATQLVHTKPIPANVQLTFAAGFAPLILIFG